MGGIRVDGEIPLLSSFLYLLGEADRGAKLAFLALSAVAIASRTIRSEDTARWGV